jgi:hypothetical protein
MFVKHNTKFFLFFLSRASVSFHFKILNRNNQHNLGSIGFSGFIMQIKNFHLHFRGIEFIHHFDVPGSRLFAFAQG